VKGIENGTFLRPSQILSAQLGTSHIVVVSGPSHAEEIGRRLPATVVAASHDFQLAELVQQLFTTERFRVYTNSDVLGVELAGAIKNVIAIAAGISDGLGYGDNSKSAILTRGLVEMTRFGLHAGAKAATFTGLAGLGDLVTTCVSPYGRNLSVGRRLGAGESLSDILGSLGGVAEGVSTARSVHEIAQRDGIEMPITAQVYAVVTGEATPRQATSNLMQRPLREE
jgi:glycerol-3-phosphate dehydrogenase (NAD(P)+)